MKNKRTTFKNVHAFILFFYKQKKAVIPIFQDGVVTERRIYFE